MLIVIAIDELVIAAPFAVVVLAAVFVTRANVERLFLTQTTQVRSSFTANKGTLMFDYPISIELMFKWRQTLSRRTAEERKNYFETMERHMFATKSTVKEAGHESISTSEQRSLSRDDGKS